MVLITIVAYRYYTRVLIPTMEKVIRPPPYRIYQQKKRELFLISIKDQKSLFSIQTTSCKFSVIHHLSERFALTHTE